MLVARLISTVFVIALSATPAAAPAGSPGLTPCRGPAGVLDLDNWKITLPVRDPGHAKARPLEVRQPELAAYTVAPWFAAAARCDGVVFRAPVDGVTTSGSSNPRSELREMADHGSTDASWSSTDGTHTLAVTEAFTHLPEVKPHVVGAQIHDADDDISVFRLEGRDLYITDGDNPHYKLVTADYALGTRFDAKFVVSNGEISAYYNGALQATLSKSFSGGYFKAGAYTQANCGNSSPCDSSNYGETVIYTVSVEHRSGLAPTAAPSARSGSPDGSTHGGLLLGIGIGIGVAATVLAGLGHRVWRRRRAR